MIGCMVAAHGVGAAGSGLNVLVVVNSNSTNSVELGNYYCERRGVPPQNLLRLGGWTGGNLSWTRSQFQSLLLVPLLDQIQARHLDHQIDFVLLSMDIPYQVTEAGSVNSTTAALFYGFKSDTARGITGTLSCSLPAAASNSYAFSEASFRDSPPDTAATNAFLAMMITADSLAQAKAVVDQGVAGDGTFPTQTAYLAKTSDPLRNGRYVLFDDAIFDTAVRGGYSLVRVDQDSPDGLTGILGYQTGLMNFVAQPNTFVPGAMADSLTSFGGVLFTPTGQTTLLAFLYAGAAGSYGTVVEPCPDLEKFPSPRDYFYQARGFSLSECYYQSLQSPRQGLLVGEPLSAPFARRASGSWQNLPPGSLLSGTTNLTLQITADDAGNPLQQVDLFLGGTFLQTITNIAPAPSNLLTVSISGRTANYVVPPNATLQTVAAGLAAAVNSISNVSQVLASATGDRITLRSANSFVSGSQVPVAADSAAGSAPALTSFVAASRADFLDSVVFPYGDVVISNVAGAGDWLQLTVIKTNGVTVTFSTTNSPPMGQGPFVQSLMDQVNSNADLQMPDGVVAQDLTANGFTLQGRIPGLASSPIQASLTGSSTVLPGPPISLYLDANLADVQPRDHLYVTAGLTNLALSFALDTTTLADGYHQLTAVAYEGSHVRTQTRLDQSVVIHNTPLSATLSVAPGGTNAALEATLVFSITVNTSAVASIELFSTGGSLGSVTNQVQATFSIPGAVLGAGLHPFYAVVTSSSGAQYRTETKCLRLISGQAPFALAIAGNPPTLSWPAVAGRAYEVFSTDDLIDSFKLRETVVPTNDAGWWSEGAYPATNRFYRVGTAW
jgi:uncharacterized protein (TIGR03790 family)